MHQLNRNYSLGPLNLGTDQAVKLQCLAASQKIVQYLFHRMKIFHSSSLGTRKPWKILPPNITPSTTASQGDNWAPGSQPRTWPVPSATWDQWFLHHSPPQSVSHLFTVSNLSSLQWLGGLHSCITKCWVWSWGSVARTGSWTWCSKAKQQERMCWRVGCRAVWESGHGAAPSELSTWNAFWK